MLSSIKNLFLKKEKPLPTLECIDCGSLYFSKIAIHTGETHAALGHLKIWIPVMEENKYDFCIITRTRTAFNMCKKYYTNKNIIYAKSPQDIEDILNNLNLKIIFYMSNTGNNLHICRFNKYRHIFLGHGDSNKSSSTHNGFKIYDEVWVSGQAHIDRFKSADINMSGTQLKIIGQPQLNYIRQTKQSHSSFLYMPTWEGTYKEQSYSSLPIAKELFCHNQIIQSLAIKMHPMTGTKNKQYSKIASEFVKSLHEHGIKTQIYPQHINVTDIMPEHDGYICDNSAIITNALFFNRPLFIYTPQGPIYADTDIRFQDFAYTFTNSEDFITRITEYRKNGDNLAKGREEALNYFISGEAMSKNNFKLFTDKLLEE